MSELTKDQRRGLCRLYRTLAELKGEDAANPSTAAEVKARAAMEGVGLVIDLPPAGGTAAWASAVLPVEGCTVEEAAAGAVATAAESILDASFDEVPGEDEQEREGEGGREGITGREWAGEEGTILSGRAPLTHVMLLRGLFDTQRDEALALVGGGSRQLLKSMAVRRLPEAMAPVLRMVANLRGVCARLVRKCRHQRSEG